jgi:large subunit ribosomal protein L3
MTIQNLMAFLLGKKSKMTQIWKDGKIIPVTQVIATPNKVVLVRTKENDGYEAVQLQLGRTRKEFKGAEASSLEKGAEIGVSVFKEGDMVKVSGTMKGRGYQGAVKRHGFHGGPATHGQKNRLRAVGSIGATAPQRVTPGHRMAGHMGDVRITVKNLKVVGIDEEKNVILIRGAAPGAIGGILEIVKL